MPSTIALADGEVVLKRTWAKTAFPVPPSLGLAFAARGRAFLTTRRLIFQRVWWSNRLGWGPESFEIDLGRIQDARVHGSSLALKLAEGERRLLLLRQQLWPPAYWYSSVTAEGWRVALEQARSALV